MQDQAADVGLANVARSPIPRFNQSPSYDFHPSGQPASYHLEGVHDGPWRTRQLTQALGWFSVGLGLAQLLAPRAMARAAGVPEQGAWLRALGARELASGVGILSQRRNNPWLWTRVAGDAMDLALLGAATRSATVRRKRVFAVAAVVAGVTLLDVLASVRQRNQQARGEEVDISEVKVAKSITINRSVDECYRFWHDFENFPSFMKHLESVQITGENTVHWTATGPAGASVEWDAELVADEPGQYIAWQSTEGSDIDTGGGVRFERAPGGRGTIVRVDLYYRPPGGAAGAMIARLFGEAPEHQVDEDLRRFKWLIETGEIPTTIGQPSGPRGIARVLFRKGEAG